MATDPPSIRIRSARPEEAPDLTQIAHAAKRFWGYPEEWISLWKPALTMTADALRHQHVFVAERQQQAIGFIACELAPPIFEISHLWVLPEHMQKKIGRRLWERAVALCRASGCNRIELDSDPYARNFYERMGALHIADVPSTPAGRLLPRMRFDVSKSRL